MAYCIEGGGSKTLSKCKRWLYAHPNESHQFLKLLTKVISEYLIEQVAAGAQVNSILFVFCGFFPFYRNACYYICMKMAVDTHGLNNFTDKLTNQSTSIAVVLRSYAALLF